MTHRDFILHCLEYTSDVARSNFGKVKGVTKPEDANQVLTQTDIAIGGFFVKQISEYFPSYNIVDEEKGVIDKNSELTWVIDPIDGTSNYAKGLPTYGIMVGLLKGTVPIAGGIALPYFSEICIAEKGKGAFCNGERIQVSDERNLSECLVAYGFDSHKNNPDFTRKEGAIVAEIVLHIRNLRSSNSVFDLIQVAKGKYGGFLNQSSKIWDNVGQQIIIEEAGGVYADFLGKPIDYSNPLSKTQDNFTFCAAPSILHKALQKIIHEKV